VDDEGSAARWERRCWVVRRLRCWVEEVDDEGCAARWERHGVTLLGGRGGRRLRCKLGEALVGGTTAALLGGRGGRHWLRGKVREALLGGTAAALLGARGGQRWLRC
jgi:hypothetical protein